MGNSETGALYLDAEFRNFEQGDPSITDYYRKLKGMADALSDLGENMSDRTLVLNLLHGLSDKFESIGRHLKRARPFSTFLEAHADLLLEELMMSKRTTPTPPPSTFVADTTPSSGSTSVPPPSTTTAGGNPKSTGNNNNKGHCGKHGKGSGSGGQPGTSGSGSDGVTSGPAPNSEGASGAGQPWPSFWNPWTSSIQMWPGTRPSLAPLPCPAQPP